MSITVQPHDAIVASDGVSRIEANGLSWIFDPEGLLVYPGQEDTVKVGYRDGRTDFWRPTTA